MPPEPRSRNTNPASCLVEVLGPDGRLVGRAVVAGPKLIVTCAHVVNAALKRKEPCTFEDPGSAAEIKVRFPFSGHPGVEIVRLASVETWLPVDRETFYERDAASLRLKGNESMPAGAGVPTLIPADYEGGAVRLFGSRPPRRNTAGPSGYVTGKVMGQLFDQVRYQVDQDIVGEIRARHGSSGGPVWDLATHQVVGLVQAVPTGEAAVDVYVLGAELIEEASAGTLYRVRECPYVGLRSFTQDDADRFFGRDDFVQTLVETARTDSLLVVTGPSGSGKSSVVRAGLVPRLAKQNLTIGVCELSGTPFVDLAGALLRAAGNDPPLSQGDLDLMERKLNDQGLSTCAAYVCTATGAERLLLVLDQFERIDKCEDAGKKEQFMKLLDDLVSRPLERVQVVLVLRDDFYHRFTQMDGPFGERLRTSPPQWLRAISATGLRDAIVKPVRTAAIPVDFEEGLVNRICQDFEGSELPPLQIVLTWLWERQVEHWLTFRAYMDLGGIEDALARYADSRLELLDKDQKAAAQRILTRLVMPDTEDIARQVKRSDLRKTDWPVAEKLSNLRLVTIGHSQTAPGEEVVVIAHEALLRKWERLREWLGMDAELRKWHVATEPRRDDWVHHNHDRDLLLGGVLLAQALDMRKQFPEDIAGLEEFIEQSELYNRSRLERAEAVRLAGLSGYVINSAAKSLPVALALGVYALRRHEVFEADFAVRRALALAGRQRIRGVEHEDLVRSVAFSPDGALLASASADRTCLVWDITADAMVARLSHNDAVATVAFNPTGDRIATAGADGLVQVWDFRAETQVAKFKHDAPVAGLTFSPDGNMVATASNDGTARIWAHGTDQAARVLQHDSAVTSVAFYPDGARVVTASVDKGVRVWEVGTGDLIARWDHGAAVRAIAFSHDGTAFATASDDRTARIFDPVGLTETRRLMHRERVTAVAFSPDGRYLASGNEDGTARVWDVDMGFEAAHVIHRGQVGSVHFSPDSTKLATASSDGTASIWDVSTGEEVARLVHQSAVYQVAFAAQGGVLATASEDRTARVWHATAGAEKLRLCHGEPVSWIAFSETGELIATAGGDSLTGPAASAGNGPAEARTVRVWNARTGTAFSGPLPHPKAIQHIAFRGSLIATACNDNHARLWDLRDGTEIASLAHDGPVRSVAFDLDAVLLATASNDRTARIWDVRTQARLATLGHGGWVGEAVFSPDGTILATAADDGAARLWAVADCLGAGVFKPIVLEHESAVYEVVFNSQGNLVATVANDGVTRIWDTGTGRMRREVSSGGRGTVAFSPDGSLIATAGDDGIAQVWQTDNDEQVAYFVHEPTVRSVTFNHDGSLLATVGKDGSARIWSIEERSEIARLLHGGEELVMAFSPDGLRLATAGEDGTGRIWALSKEELIEQACERLTRNLTRAEWNRYFPRVPYQPLRHDLGNLPDARPSPISATQVVRLHRAGQGRR
jgi:WD40 repeat protein